MFKFAQHGQTRRVGQRAAAAHGARSSTTSAIVKSMHTEAINHDPAITFIQTGSQLAGPAEHRARGSATAWAARTSDLPAFVVHDLAGQRQHDRPADLLRPAVGQRLPADRSTRASRFRAGGDPVLYLSNPPGVDAPTAGAMLDGLGAAQPARSSRRSAIRRSHTRIAQYEMAFRMQTGGAGADRPVAASREHVLELYGPDAQQARHVRRQLPAGPAAGRARRALRAALPPRLGPARQPARADPRPVPATPTSRRPRWSRTSSSAACSTTRSSSGAASSAARSTARAR